MDKVKIAEYLNYLSGIMDFHEKLGTIKSMVIAEEYRRVHGDFVDILKKEQEKRDETRKRE